MDKETISKAIENGNDVALSVADAIVSAFTVVPPIQTLKGIATTYQGLRESIFNEKLTAFFEQAEKLDEKRRKEFLDRLGKNQGDFFKRIIIAIDRLDEKDKAIMVGKLFCALVDEKLTMDEFRKLIFVIDNSFLTDLQYFILAYDKDSNVEDNWPDYLEGDSLQQHFAAMGFLLQDIDVTSIDGGDASGKSEKTHSNTELNFYLSQLGSNFIRNTK
jgi:hypothetical protein